MILFGDWVCLLGLLFLHVGDYSGDEVGAVNCGHSFHLFFGRYALLINYNRVRLLIDQPNRLRLWAPIIDWSVCARIGHRNRSLIVIGIHIWCN